MDSCVFCEIASGARPAAMVFADPSVVAFLDHAPLFPGHVLLIPRAHVTTLEDLPPDLGAGFIEVASRLSRAVRLGTGAQGTFVAMNNTVSQSVPHLHAHIVPRTRGDGLRGFFWPRTRYHDEEHRDQVRAAVAAALLTPPASG